MDEKDYKKVKLKKSRATCGNFFFCIIMLIRAGHAVRASVVFALVLLYTCQPGCWDCRRSCVRDWSSPVCWSEVDTTFPTAGSPAFLFHLRQYRTSRASLKDNVANEPLLSGVVSESCFVNWIAEESTFMV